MIVKEISYEENVIVETDKGTFDVGCMGGAMISIEGDFDYRSITNKKIIDAIIDEYSLTLVFDDGEVCFVDDTGGEGVDAGWIDDISEGVINESQDPTKHQVYYTLFYRDYTKEEQDILREYTEANQNGYADLIEIQEDSDVEEMLRKKGFETGDEVIIHYKW